MTGRVRGRRVAAWGAVSLAVVLPMTACASAEQAPDAGHTSPAAATEPAATEPAATEPAATEPAATEPAAQSAATEVAVTVTAGRLDPDPGQVGVRLGDTVRIRVDSDEPDAVHVHGYDELAEVAPGSPATIELVADQPGVFEVELERSGLLLFQLAVR